MKIVGIENYKNQFYALLILRNVCSIMLKQTYWVQHLAINISVYRFQK